jgi:hypothetical protein
MPASRAATVCKTGEEVMSLRPRKAGPNRRFAVYFPVLRETKPVPSKDKAGARASIPKSSEVRIPAGRGEAYGGPDR